LVAADVVEGRGTPDPVSGAVESTQAEVDRVIEIAIDHAMTRPQESLAIIAATAVHANRIREALAAEVRANVALGSFFSGAAPEPVVVTDITDVSALARDAVVLTLGFGRTPHGRVLHRFGAIAEPGGAGVLLGALGVARRRLHVVSCFGIGDLDPERMRSPGAQLLGELLTLVQLRSGVSGVIAETPDAESVEPDRLLVDLGERLWRAGYPVETNYGHVDGERIPLVVGHPDLPGQWLVAVLTDDAEYVQESSVRARDRQWATRLERLGWVVTQVWSAAVFLDPTAEADRVRALVQDARDARITTTGGVEPVEHVEVPILEVDEIEIDEINLD
jgi:hypothetical protein